MAVHAGVFYFDNRPTDVERRWIAASVQPLAPDGVSMFAHDGIVIAHGAHHVWTEDTEGQPVRSVEGLLATWDGRLDNRDDLALRLHGQCAGNGVSDAALALATFARWGIDGLRSLIGDWTLVIWDGARRTLFLARDFMGVRPLYYYSDSHAVMWSSSLGELAVRAGVVDNLDETFVARFMTLRYAAQITPYARIQGVSTGSCLSFSRMRRVAAPQCFWHLEPASIRYANSGQYEEQLRDLWGQAVGVRLRTKGTVWAELSGGLDSSSIVCMADTLIESGRVSANNLQPVSHVTLQSSEGDERRFIAEVEAQIGRRSVLLGLEEYEAARGNWDWETPLATKSVDVATIERMRSHGASVILSGRVGDIVMGCFPDHSVAVLEDLADWRLWTAFAKTRLWSRSCQKPFVEIATALLATELRTLQGLARSPTLTERQLSALNMLHPRLQPLALGEDLTAADAWALPASKRSMALQLLRYRSGALATVPTPPTDVIYTYPFVHRPLIEFVMAIPAGELSAPGITRSLMRRAFTGLVPHVILSRTSKGHYPPAVLRVLRALLKSMPPVEKLQVVQRGWLAPQPLATAMRNLADGRAEMGGEVRLAVLLEQWLDSRDRQGPAAMPIRKEVTTNAVLNA